MGAVAFVMVRFHVGEGAEESAGTGTQPESNPLARGSQGLVKDDCVTVWFPGAPENTKDTVDPTGATMLLGLKVKAVAVPLPPTWTGITLGAGGVAEDMAAMEQRIIEMQTSRWAASG